MSVIDYGVDILCVEDMSPDLREVSGLGVLSQAILHRLQTPRGTLESPTDPPDPRDLAYGTDVRGLLGLATTKDQRAALGGMIENEALKEDAVQTATATVTVLSPAPNVRLRIDLVIVTVNGLILPLVLTIDQVNVTLLSGGAQ